MELRLPLTFKSLELKLNNVNLAWAKLIYFLQPFDTLKFILTYATFAIGNEAKLIERRSLIWHVWLTARRVGESSSVTHLHIIWLYIKWLCMSLLITKSTSLASINVSSNGIWTENKTHALGWKVGFVVITTSQLVLIQLSTTKRISSFRLDLLP